MELLKGVISFFREVGYHFSRDKVFILASSVVYSTLVSMVPFLAFTMALISAFGALSEVQALLQEYLLVQFGEIAESSYMEIVEGFVLNAGSLGVVGLISFMITSVFLLNRVWMTVNQIYRTSLHSNVLLRMARFITVLVISTLLLSAYVSVSTLVRRELLISVEATLTIRFLRYAAPWVFLFLVIFLLTLMVPNTKVKTSSAAIGSIIGVLMFQVSNLIFSKFITQAINYSIIYGSFATVLIFLLWVYLIWIIIFMSVEISYVHQYRPKRSFSASLADTPSELLAHGIDILVEICRGYKKGSGSVTVRELSLQLSLPGEKTANYLDLLERSGFILRMERGGKSYVPARPLEDMFIKDVIRVIYKAGVGEHERPSSGHELSDALLEGGLEQVEQVSMQELVKRH